MNGGCPLSRQKLADRSSGVIPLPATGPSKPSLRVCRLPSWTSAPPIAAPAAHPIKVNISLVPASSVAATDHPTHPPRKAMTAKTKKRTWITSIWLTATNTTPTVTLSQYALDDTICSRTRHLLQPAPEAQPDGAIREPPRQRHYTKQPAVELVRRPRQWLGDQSDAAYRQLVCSAPSSSLFALIGNFPF